MGRSSLAAIGYRASSGPPDVAFANWPADDPSRKAKPSRVHSWHRRPETAGLEAGLESIAFIDGLGVTRLQLQEGVTAGSWLATGAAVRNARGQIVTQGSVPSAYTGSLTAPTLDLDADAVPVTQTYDAYGRPTSTWEGPPSGASVGTRVLARMAYSPLKHVSQDANDLAPSATLGSSAIAETDGHGRLVRSRKIGNAHSSTFEYAYLPTGEAIRERRTSRFTGESTVRERTFDTLGRMVKQLEPNTTTNGRPMLYAYNDAGWLVGTSDSRGCGENVAYDAAGRVVYRDSSPCTQEQGPYTPPAPPGSANFGDGTEAFYRYDAPEPGESSDEYGHAAALPGRLVAQRDLGTHTRYKYDALGRSTGVGRRVTLPGRPASPLADRYTEHWYRQETAYDINDRVVSSSTGADVPELLAPGSSTVSMTYGRLGQLDELQSSYGMLIQANVVRPDGRTQAVVYGDQASTTVGFEYYESRVNRPVFRTTVARNAPARWSEPDYTPASPTEPTQQTTLSEAIRFYDDNENPTHILETPNGLPEGASSRNQHVTYDDMDRVSGVTYDYFGNDARTSPFAHEAGTSKPVPRAQLAKRTQAQSFEYDYLGNITSSRSDAANGAFDRHLGTELHGSSTNGPSQLRSADGTTARYDSAGNLVDLMVERPGPCDAGKPCTQRFHYVWNETGQLERASRWDLTLASGESAGDAQILLRTPTWDLRYAYSDDGQRVLKSAQDGGQEARHTLEVFGSLRVENARFDGADYERTGQTEKVSLAGVGKVEVLEQSVPDGQAGEARLYLRIPDALGSSSFVIDQRTSEVVEHTTYDAFGTTDSDYRPERWGAHRDAHKFTDKEEDIEVGLVYFGARYYHPNLRRWISPDPLTIHGWGADPNPYAYVSGQVLRQTDPWGLTGKEAGAPNPSDPGCGHCTAEPIGPGMDGKPQEKGAGGSGRSSGSGESRPPPPPPPPPGAASQVRGALASFGASVGAAAFRTVKWSTDYSRTAMFTVLTAGAARPGHELEDPRHLVQEITGVPESSSAGVVGMVGGHVATAVLEAPAAAANMVQNGGRALARRGLTAVAKRTARRAAIAVRGTPGGVTKFLHGTLDEVARGMVGNLKPVSTATAPYAQGSFFAHQASVPGALQAASHWPVVQGKAASTGVSVLEISIPNATLDTLRAQGLVRTGAVAGMGPFFPMETIFSPAALDVINSSASFRLIAPSF